jgi:hypothetical protein
VAYFKASSKVKALIEGPWKTRKHSVRIADLRAKIQTPNILNTWQE